MRVEGVLVLVLLTACGADPPCGPGRSCLAATGAADAGAPPDAAPAPDGGPSAVVVPASSTGGGIPGLGGHTAFCPPYLTSPLKRPRAHQVTVGPHDDWIGAIERAGPDTEVVLRRGRYDLGSHYAVQIHDDVTVRGETGDPADVVVRGRGYGPRSEGLMVVGSRVTIAELSVTQVRNHAVSVKGELGAKAPHLYRLRLFDTGTQQVKLTPAGSSDGVIACSEIFYNPGAARGDYVDAIDLHGAVDWSIRDNYIHGINGDGTGCEVDADCGTYVSGPAILVWNHSRGTVVERNVLLDNYRNISFGLGTGHEGGVIRNNFVERRRPGDAGIELQGAVGARVTHNTVRVAGYKGALELRDSSEAVLVNNLLSAPVWNRGSATFQEAGTIGDAADRDFAAPEDYRLRPGSRAIGAGVPAPDVATDIEGHPRHDRYDVGCFQEQP
jgi:hypothetical protein